MTDALSGVTESGLLGCLFLSFQGCDVDSLHKKSPANGSGFFMQHFI
jgi:hypothetical protein